MSKESMISEKINFLYCFNYFHVSKPYFFLLILQISLCLFVAIYVLICPEENLESITVFVNEIILFVFLFSDLIFRTYLKRKFIQEWMNLYDIMSFIFIASIVLVYCIYFCCIYNYDHILNLKIEIGTAIIIIKEAIQIIRTIIMFAMSARVRSVSHCDLLLDHVDHSGIENSPMIGTLKPEHMVTLELQDQPLEIETI